jgi:hypothetical protein
MEKGDNIGSEINFICRELARKGLRQSNEPYNLSSFNINGHANGVNHGANMDRDVLHMDRQWGPSIRAT